ncbi:MAG: SDR family oxidoreductase [Actinomycetota bacterium]|nr:SDR family oxidoreductase [Actinomycetota bacterium]
MSKTVLISGASSGFGALTARALADAGYMVYAGMRDVSGRNKEHANEAARYSRDRQVALTAVELDVSSEDSVQQAARTVLAAHPLDVLIHNAGHMVTGPAEAFTAGQLAEVYDTNVLGTQRLNRAILPYMRERQDGLVVWVGSTSTRGGTPPYLAPYFAAKAAMDSLAVSYALELARFGIETSIIVPGSFTHGTSHFAHSGTPEDRGVADDYQTRYAGLMDQVAQKLRELEPPGADAGAVAEAIVAVVQAAKGTRPFRVHIDPADDGAAVVNAVGDRIRAEFLRRIGLADLLHPSMA